MKDGFWDRLAARVQPTETLRTIENPRAIARAFSLAMWGAVVQIVMTGVLLAAFDETTLAWAAVGLAGAFFVAWVAFAATGSMSTAFVIAFVAGTTGNIYAHIALGGYAYSGAIFLFGISFVLAAALLLGKQAATVAALTYAIAGVILGFFEGSLQERRIPPDPALTTILFVVVLVGTINIVVPLIVYFMGRLRHEHERAEGLLLNVLPGVVAAELKETGSTTARRFDEVSVLFADIVGFTPLSASIEPEELVDRLNEVFTYFDTLAERHGVEKIRTIGDTYMVAAGIPVPRLDHAQALAAMALDMLDFASQGAWSFRIGINSGPAVAGVIGTRKFQYDVWGDTVNTASRMESHGEPGRIQISEATYSVIKNQFPTIPRGPIEVKGKGTVTTWWLEASGQSGAKEAHPRK
jgi:class 3 adenylate cyclase